MGQGQDGDQDMEPSVKQESTQSNANVIESSSKLKERETIGGTSTLKTYGCGDDVIVPLATGYLIQVPIRSNSVLREKHSFEALGVEVHLLHLQRTVSTNSEAATLTGGGGTGGGRGSSSVSTPNVNSSDVSSPYHPQHHHPHHQQHASASYQRPMPSSPSTFQQYRAPAFPASAGTSSVGGGGGVTGQYQQQMMGSPTMSPTTSTFAANNGTANSGGGSGIGSGGMGASTTTGSGSGSMSTPMAMATTPTLTVKPAVAQNTTREILHQFHALSYLSLAPVQANSLPYHLVLLERLSRVLLMVQA
ncbi:hypothetical protein BGZ94_002013 [Podila epigama]|nr:hypothetical protein BGZ94_002013 [Podila epigama]